MWKETLKQLQTPRNSLCVVQFGRWPQEPCVWLEYWFPFRTGVPLASPSSPMALGTLLWTSVDVFVAFPSTLMLLVSKEDKSSSVFNKPLKTVPLWEPGESHPPTSHLSDPTSGAKELRGALWYSPQEPLSLLFSFLQKSNSSVFFSRGWGQIWVLRIRVTNLQVLWSQQSPPSLGSLSCIFLPLGSPPPSCSLARLLTVGWHSTLSCWIKKKKKISLLIVFSLVLTQIFIFCTTFLANVKLYRKQSWLPEEFSHLQGGNFYPCFFLLMWFNYVLRLVSIWLYFKLHLTWKIKLARSVLQSTRNPDTSIAIK